METEEVLLKRDGEVMVVSLNRSNKRNALNERMIRRLQGIFSDPPRDVRAAVIHSLGKHFSAGMDLSELDPESTALYEINYSMLWYKAFESIEFGAVPVVAVLQGGVIGGGLELACAAHIRVAEPTTFYSLPEGQRGIFVGGGGSTRIPRLIGTARVSDMLLTGRIYGAAEGERIGFSQYLVDDGAGLEKGLELAHKIAANAPLTNFAIVHALPRIASSSQDHGLLTEALMSAVTKQDPAAKARVRAFVHKGAR